MKKLFTIIALTVLFNVNAQVYTTHNTTDSHGSIWMGNPNIINTGLYNSGLGLGALASNTTGESNTASGRSSLVLNTTGSTNTTSGVQSLYTNTTGSQNTALGYNAVASSEDAINQTIIGHNARGAADNTVVLGNYNVTAVYMGGKTDIYGLPISPPANVYANGFVRSHGIASEFLKADGSVDSSIYITAADVTPQADSDWNSMVSPTQILNKPTTISTQQADEITANTLKRSYPVLDEDKLATIETGAQVNVQSDWDATTGDAFILNKPVITDDQQLGNFILSAGSLLSIAIERGNVVSVNLAPLLADLAAENDELTSIVSDQQSQIDQQQSLIDDLIIRMEIREDCACDPTLGNNDNTLQPDKAYLLQNIPNPFNNTTSVGYFVPYTNAKAHIVISTMAGQIVHNIELSNLGVGAVSIDNSRMASALYLYTLYVDGKRIDTKRMIVE
tara:strand:+ start:207 stop:1553 length:1347 start_codon:yes stop_codon:yes gene_type:complete